MSQPLYEEGDFKIAPWKGSGWESWIWHWCGSEKKWRSCGLINRAYCGWCGTEPSEGLYGLWKLHNWEIIQKVGGK